jgi:hypothetical protein
LGKARFGNYDRRCNNQKPKRTHGKPLQGPTGKGHSFLVAPPACDAYE